MADFYVFEGSFFQGGGGWELLEVCTDLDQARRTAEDYLREGNWTFSPPSETFEITAHTDGTVHSSHPLYPHTRITVPGLTPMTFDADGKPFGGVPEPDGPYEGVASIWDNVEIHDALVANRFRGASVSIDWDAIDLPVLPGPRLADDAELLLDQETGTHVVIDAARLSDVDYLVELVGVITALDDSVAEAAEEFLAGLPELDDPDARGDALSDFIDEVDRFRLLWVGSNSLFE